MNRWKTLSACSLLLFSSTPALFAQGAGKAPPGRNTAPPPVQTRGGEQVRTTARHRVTSTNHGSPTWHAQRQAAAREQIRNEHAYRIRTARIERMREIYAANGQQDRVRELDRLRERVRVLYREQQQVCREDLGEETYLELQDRIRLRTQLRDQDRTTEPDLDRLRDRDQDRDQDMDRDRDRDRDGIEPATTIGT